MAASSSCAPGPRLLRPSVCRWTSGLRPSAGGHPGSVHSLALVDVAALNVWARVPLRHICNLWVNTPRVTAGLRAALSPLSEERHMRCPLFGSTSQRVASWDRCFRAHWLVPLRGRAIRAWPGLGGWAWQGSQVNRSRCGHPVRWSEGDLADVQWRPAEAPSRPPRPPRSPRPSLQEAAAVPIRTAQPVRAEPSQRKAPLTAPRSLPGTSSLQKLPCPSLL